MTSDSDFFEVLGGSESTGWTKNGTEVGLAVLPMPDGAVRVTLAYNDAEGGRFMHMEVSSDLANEWGSMLSSAAVVQP
jgi:hypothetical protein